MAQLPVTRIVDAHLHVWPDPRPERPYPWTPDPHPLEDLVPVLNRYRIDRAMQVTPTIMEYDNAYGLEVSERTRGRIGVFGRFDPTAPDVHGRLSQWMGNRGALGTRLTFFGASAAETGQLLGLQPFWEAAEELDAPVAVLAPNSLPELAEVARRHPGLRLIVDHLGLGVYPGSRDPYAGWTHLAELAAQGNIRMKISTLVETSTESFPFRDVHHRLAEAVALFGADRLMWASNYPVVLSHCGYGESLEFLGECDFLTADQLEWLTHGTVESLIGRPG